MRKEIFYAIFAGGILGLVIAFGVWRANQALKPQINQQETNTNTPDNSTAMVNTSSGITIASPQNEDVVTENPLKITGVTKPQNFVTISTEDQDYVLQSDREGTFESEVSLTGGINQVVITAIDEDGTTHTENLTLVYSTEFK